MSKFEFVSKYENCGLSLPVRSTEGSAGYDLAAADNFLIPSFAKQMSKLLKEYGTLPEGHYYNLEQMANFTKAMDAKPTLVSTGLKCELDPDTYLELSVRSSTPFKYWLILANGVGIIDRDYYNNASNEGEIFFQLINLSPYPLLIRKGEIIGQGIVKPYLKIDNDKSEGIRAGGFGSTTK